MSRIITIAAKFEEAKKFDDLLSQYYKCKEAIEKGTGQKVHARMDIGLSHLGFASLGLAKDQSDIVAIKLHLEKGMRNVIEYGMYAFTDIQTRLKPFEDQLFATNNMELVKELGEHFFNYFLEKEDEASGYRLATEIMFRWKNWEGDNANE